MKTVTSYVNLSYFVSFKYTPIWILFNSSFGASVHIDNAQKVCLIQSKWRHIFYWVTQPRPAAHQEYVLVLSCLRFPIQNPDHIHWMYIQALEHVVQRWNNFFSMLTNKNLQIFSSISVWAEKLFALFDYVGYWYSSAN
jgi:hypothetical protein